MKIAEKFGRRLKELRTQKKLTQEDIAYKAEVTVYYISKMERGLANPSLETLVKIASALNISLSDLVKNF